MAPFPESLNIEIGLKKLLFERSTKHLQVTSYICLLAQMIASDIYILQVSGAERHIALLQMLSCCAHLIKASSSSYMQQSAVFIDGFNFQEPGVQQRERGMTSML